MGMTESQAEASGDDTDSRRARCAGDEARSNNILTLTASDSPMIWS